MLKQRYVYTPEMVVDGIGHDTGRERAGIERLLAEAQRRSTGARHARTVAHRGRRAHHQARRLDARRPAGRRHASLYDRRHSTPVASGENQGRMLDNFNVVRRFEVLSRWDGAAAQLDVPSRPAARAGRAVIVQRADHGPVIGCNKLEPMVSG